MRIVQEQGLREVVNYPLLEFSKLKWTDTEQPYLALNLSLLWQAAGPPESPFSLNYPMILPNQTFIWKMSYYGDRRTPYGRLCTCKLPCLHVETILVHLLMLVFHVCTDCPMEKGQHLQI